MRVGKTIANMAMATGPIQPGRQRDAASPHAIGPEVPVLIAPDRKIGPSGQKIGAFTLKIEFSFPHVRFTIVCAAATKACVEACES